MTTPTLTDLVDDALAVLAPGIRPTTLFYHPQVAALYTVLARYETALRLAEAAIAWEDVPDAWDRMSRHERVSIGGYHQMVEGIVDALSDARAAYREARS